ncbi:hypothetical protein DFJ73DRAFT_38118 [Zopfochytrium polystomum]|nr:hypothetical protein DFJ73DRAFT_38118 [Zopfochytrium polystomum]
MYAERSLCAGATFGHRQAAFRLLPASPLAPACLLAIFPMPTATAAAAAAAVSAPPHAAKRSFCSQFPSLPFERIPRRRPPLAIAAAAYATKVVGKTVSRPPPPPTPPPPSESAREEGATLVHPGQTSPLKGAPTTPPTTATPPTDAAAAKRTIEFGPAQSVDLDGSDAFGLLGVGGVGGGRQVRRVTAEGFDVDDLRIAGPVVLVNQGVYLWDAPQYGVGGPDEAALDALLEESRASAAAAAAAAGPGPRVVDNPSSVFHGWTADVFKLFEIVAPPPDIVFVGTGPQLQVLPPVLKSHFHSLGMQVEVMATRNAANTYNVLSREGRRVAAALLPLVPTSGRTGRPLVDLQRERVVVGKGVAGEEDGAERRRQN